MDLEIPKHSVTSDCGSVVYIVFKYCIKLEYLNSVQRANSNRQVSKNNILCAVRIGVSDPLVEICLFYFELS